MLYLTIIGGTFIAWLILVALFTPHIPYHVEAGVDARSEHFVQVLESTLQTTMTQGNRVRVFTDGTGFYPAMLDAIRGAQETVNLECYIFKSGPIGEQFIDALSDRARHGVRVTVVVDALGSFGSFRWIRRRLGAAGCRVEPYQRFTWYRLGRLNNRTHRELLVVDGRIGFAGGAGVADWWAGSYHDKPIWRDMMVGFEGPVVSDIQGIVAENWLECCGEILTGPETFKARRPAGATAAFALKSSPSDRATASRVLFQTLIESAQERVAVSTPYFLPDQAFRRAFIRVATRGVEIKVIVPGAATDQRWVRLASRRMFGELLRAGIRIYEYAPGMTHVKSLLVDNLWATIGTTNFDNRSFEHNDEVNIAIRDGAVAGRLNQDFERDLANSREVRLQDWERRPVWEKLIGAVAWILERQQ
jgi:cardiolipin synthase